MKSKRDVATDKKLKLEKHKLSCARCKTSGKLCKRGKSLSDALNIVECAAFMEAIFGRTNWLKDK